MKKQKLILTIFIFFFISTAFSLPRINNKQKTAVNLLSKYYKRGHFLVTNYLKNPSHSINVWLRGPNDIYNLLHYMAIAVHETSHFYRRFGKSTGRERATAASSGGRNVISFNQRTPVTRTTFINISRAPNWISKKRFKKILKGLSSSEDREFLESVYKKYKVLKSRKLIKTDQATKKRVLKILKRSDYYKPKKYIRTPDGRFVPASEYRAPKKYYKVFISKNTFLSFPLTKTFPAKKIANTIPVHLRKFQFSRYNTYINSYTPFIGSQLYGIYGLFDEYVAFYTSTDTALKFYKYYRTKLPQTVETWRWFFKTVNWHYWSYYDFKYYMMRYVIYAKKHYPKIYKKIINNKKFIKTFRYMTSKWEKLMTYYAKIKSELYPYLKRIGIRIYEGPKYTSIIGRRDRKGVLSFNRVIKMLKAELRKPIYRGLL